MYSKDFLKRMTLRAENDDSVVCYNRKNKTFCLSLRTGKVGIAKQNKDDRYDYYIGTGLAYCRLKNIKVPEEKNDYKRGTMIRYNRKKYYVVNAYYDQLSLLGGFSLDVFNADCNSIQAGQKIERLHLIKEPEILKNKNAEINFRMSPSKEVLQGYIREMKRHEEVSVEYLPYANMIIMQDLDSNLKETKEINYNIEENYTLEENMTMAYCELKGIEPYIIINNTEITNNYVVLKATEKYRHCLNTVTGRLETLKVVK